MLMISAPSRSASSRPAAVLPLAVGPVRISASANATGSMRAHSYEASWGMGSKGRASSRRLRSKGGYLQSLSPANVGGGVKQARELMGDIVGLIGRGE